MVTNRSSRDGSFVKQPAAFMVKVFNMYIGNRRISITTVNYYSQI